MADNAYDALTDHADDARWAYGTGFADPLAGVDLSFVDGVDRAELTTTCLALGDDALILSHRLQQWVTRAPELEDEVAIANIALDLLGQARLLLTRSGSPEDSLAYERGPADFRNVLLAERADEDFAHLMARLLVLSSWRLAVMDGLAGHADPVLAAVAAKAVKELTYHREYAAGWVIRLGDGTDLSHARMQAAVDTIWPLTGELSPSAEVSSVLGQVLAVATLRAPELPPPVESPGRRGEHTPALAEILDEMQGFARTVPGGVW